MAAALFMRLFRLFLLHKLGAIPPDSLLDSNLLGSLCQKMVYYVHVIGRQHGVTSSKIKDQIGRLEDTIVFALPEGSKWHRMFYYQGRKRVHLS